MRALVVDEMPIEALWDAAHDQGTHAAASRFVSRAPANCTRAGGQVHWARDADEANRIIVGILKARREREVIKVKTMTSMTRLNAALEDAGILPHETDWRTIIQLGTTRPRTSWCLRCTRTRPRFESCSSGRWGCRSRAHPPPTWRMPRGAFCAKFLRPGFSGANYVIADSGSVWSLSRKAMAGCASCCRGCSSRWLASRK